MFYMCLIVIHSLIIKTLFPGLENIFNIPIFWNIRLQLLLQHDIYIPILPNAGREFV